MHSHFVIGCDGVRSKVRDYLGGKFDGEAMMQHFYNLHFRSKELAKQLRAQNREGMLFFLYSKHAASVLIEHNLDKAEFVLQIPYYPPAQSASNLDEAGARDLIEKICWNETGKDVEVLDIGTWDLSAQVCIKLGCTKRRAIVAGDAAHSYPPAGGFGMNTGIGDAFQAAITMALAKKKPDEYQTYLRQYRDDRKLVGNMVKNMAVHNYKKSIAIAN